MIDHNVFCEGKSGATKQGAKPFWSLRQISFVYAKKQASFLSQAHPASGGRYRSARFQRAR
jgi:hypothetical protein